MFFSKPNCTNYLFIMLLWNRVPGNLKSRQHFPSEIKSRCRTNLKCMVSKKYLTKITSVYWSRHHWVKSICFLPNRWEVCSGVVFGVDVLECLGFSFMKWILIWIGLVWFVMICADGVARCRLNSFLLVCTRNCLYEVSYNIKGDGWYELLSEVTS